MKVRLKTLIQIGSVTLAYKVVFVVVVLCAVYYQGLSGMHTLWLGAELLPVNDTIQAQFAANSKAGLLVNRVIEHSPADQAGVKRGDILLSIDSLPIYEAQDIRVVLENKAFRDSAQIVYLREGVVFSTRLTLDYRAVHAGAGTLRSVERYQLTAVDFIELLVLGLVAGTLSGMIGCGGGILQVSLLMTMFGFEIFLAKVVSLVSCSFMSLSSSYRYIKQGRVDRAALTYLIPSSLLGVLIGVGVSMLLERHVLELLLGLFLAYAALDLAYQVYVDQRNGKRASGEEKDGREPKRDRSALVWAGFPMGLCSAVLGITGGVVGTPLQRYLLSAPMKTCIANTLVTVIFVSLLGGFLLLIEGLVRDYFSFQAFVMVLLAVMPGAVLGGQVGARLNERLPTSIVKGVYAVVALLMAYRILTSI